VPIYDYLCATCRHVTEVIHGINDPGPRFCPACGADGTMRKALVSPAIHFKGSGWAKKDRSSSSSTRARSGTGSSADGGSNESGSGAGSSSESTGSISSESGDRSGSATKKKATDSGTGPASPSASER
jgi:putative FmdB family regulatory protein